MPCDTRLRVVLINTEPSQTSGDGISSNVVVPVLKDWIICFMRIVVSFFYKPGEYIQFPEHINSVNKCGDHLMDLIHLINSSEPVILLL